MVRMRRWVFKFRLASGTRATVFTSDHGWQLGELQQWTKHNLFEAAPRRG